MARSSTLAQASAQQDIVNTGKARERHRERDRESDRESDRERQTETERARENRETERQIPRDRETDVSITLAPRLQLGSTAVKE